MQYLSGSLEASSVIITTSSGIRRTNEIWHQWRRKQKHLKDNGRLNDADKPPVALAFLFFYSRVFNNRTASIKRTCWKT